MGKACLEQHVSVILNWRQLNELLLTTVEHYRAWLSAKYAADWAAIHAQRSVGREKARMGQKKSTPPKTSAPATAPQPTAQQADAGFASAFGSVYGSANGKAGAGDKKIF